MKKFVLLLLLLLGSRFFDVYTTYLYTPDLSKENNPIVSVLGQGWAGALLVQCIVICLLMYCLWVYCFKKVELIPFNPNMSLKEFASLFYFNDSQQFSKIFYKLPTNKYSLSYSLGGIMIKALIIIGLLVGTSTTFLILSKSYQQFYKAYKIPLVLYSIMIGLVVFFSIDFFKKEKAKY